MGIESQNLSTQIYVPQGPLRNDSHKTETIKTILTQADANKDGVVSSLEYYSYRDQQIKSESGYTGNFMRKSAECFIYNQFEDLAKATGGNTQPPSGVQTWQFNPSTINIDKIDEVAAKDGYATELSTDDISIAKKPQLPPWERPDSTSMDQLSRQNNLIMQLLMMLLQRFMPQFGGMMRF